MVKAFTFTPAVPFELILCKICFALVGSVVRHFWLRNSTQVPRSLVTQLVTRFRKWESEKKCVL